ncbi:hypothetical protein APHAL10511_002960 [Amanita phalloides]|nr:hypothetical protein APHAL10511_002960 [Amanita phalloides]
MQAITNFALSHRSYATAGALVTGLLLFHLSRRKPLRQSFIPPNQERALILGGTSGVGQSIALQYAQRGVRVCVVGRRQALVDDVAAECGRLGDKRALGVCADFTDVDSMLRVRDAIEKEWGGLDTLVIAAGVSALLPLMDVAQVPSVTGRHPANTKGPSKSGIEQASNIATEALRGNYIGPLISAVTFIPLLQQTSRSPSILLISSLAAVIPAPTRTLYASTKSASLLLFQSLSIEHPLIAFTHVLPSTIEGSFRASAVDAVVGGGTPNMREKDPNRYGLKKGDVARRCIAAVDSGKKSVFIPASMRIAVWVYWVFPGVIEWFARKKYKFEV